MDIRRRAKLLYFHFIRRQKYGTPPPLLEKNECVCKNCGHHFRGNVCNRCGQSRNVPRISYSTTIKHFFSIMFHINHGFWVTFFELIYRPGYMIKDYIAGKRIKYYHPFAMLFVVAAIYIIMAELMYPNIMKKKQLDNMSNSERVEMVKQGISSQYENERSKENKHFLSSALANINKIKEDNIKDIIRDSDDDDKDRDKDKKEDQKEDAIDKKVKNFQFRLSNAQDTYESLSDKHLVLKNASEMLVSWFQHNRVANIILALPFLTFASRFVFRKKRHGYNTTEHLIIQAYIFSQILILSLFYLPFRGATVDSTINVAFLPIFLLYTWDFKQLFNYTWLKTIWKVIQIILFSCLLIFCLAIILLALLVGIITLI